MSVKDVPQRSIESLPRPNLAINTPGRQPCVFMDRDGVINRADAFVNTPDGLDAALMPEEVAAIARLNKETSARAVLVTNQGGIGTGHMSDQTARAINERLEERVEQAGGHLDAIYYCPNGTRYKAPAGTVDGRKPEPGMLLAAARDFGPAIDLADSYMIGDMTTDIAAGKNAGVTTILVQTGFGGEDGRVAVTPDHVSRDLADAIDWIISREQAASVS